MINFLPDGFEELKMDKSYINISKLPEGEHKMRIVMRPIAGWVDWKDKKPFRYRPNEKPSSSFDLEKPIKPFWACYVWDYSKEALFIMEIVQMSLLKGLTNLGKDPDWGDFTTYDIKIKKEGNGQTSKYFINPVPHKKMSDKIKQALADRPVCLEALYAGKDPWTDFVGSFDTAPILDGSSDTVAMVDDPLDTLKESMSIDGLDIKPLQDYINELSDSRKKPVDSIIESALLKDILPQFKKKYSTWLKNREEALELVGAV